MRAIGIRELKNNLSHFVRLVEGGESVLVTHRGTVVAELRPPGRTTVPPEPERGLAALVREGRAKAGAEHDPALYARRPPAVPDGSVRTLLDAERAE